MIDGSTEGERRKAAFKIEWYPLGKPRQTQANANKPERRETRYSDRLVDWMAQQGQVRRETEGEKAMGGNNLGGTRKDRRSLKGVLGCFVPGLRARYNFSDSSVAHPSLSYVCRSAPTKVCGKSIKTRREIFSCSLEDHHPRSRGKSG